ncbi:hypothetical protein [Gilliamella sp. wkB112]|uniref:hypothetical protein n=1 Tax=Gilliamella sp. wkB112 TaxID=3120257 RepID=UPI00080E0D32|nr:hypothetical protein [Gilliamella apicola]OCG00756.1 hypothetical protein A9G12_03045 [Gilliamella apicola]
MITFEINPFTSVNDFKFGLTQSAIAKKNGKPFKVEIDNIMEEIREYREGSQLTFIKNKLVDVIIKKMKCLFLTI